MRFIKRLLKPDKKPAITLVDPVFGEMAYHMGSWVAYTDFPRARAPVEVLVWGREQPSSFQQRVFQKLLQGYGELESALEQALFGEYETLRCSEDYMTVDNGSPAIEELPQAAGEVWQIFHPVTIDIYEAGYSPEYDCRIYYDFRLDPEHNRSVFLQSGKIAFVASE